MANLSNEQKGLMLIEWLIILAIIVIIAAVPIFDAYSCKVRWADSGMQARWGLISGCRVSKDDKNWIPEERYREIGND